MVDKEMWMKSFARGMATNRTPGHSLSDPKTYEHAISAKTVNSGFWYARWLKATGHLDRMEREIKEMLEGKEFVSITNEPKEVTAADLCESLREMLDIIEAQSSWIGTFPKEQARIKLAEERIVQTMKQQRAKKVAA